MMKRKIIFGLCIFLLVFNFTYSQEKPKITKSNYKKQDAGFPLAWRSVREGNKLYNAGVGTYRMALEKYFTALDYNDANAALHYRLGVCYLFSGKSRVKALEHIKKAYEINPYVASDINFLLARAYHLNMEFDKAIEEYQKYQTSLTPNKIKRLKIDIEKYITECKHGKEMVNFPVRVIIKNSGKGINSVEDEYNPVFTKDYKEMYFTSRRSNTMKGRRSPIDNKYYEDIYMSMMEKEEWKAAEHLEKPFNTKHNNAAIGFSDNDRKFYSYNGNKKGGDILVSVNKKGIWRKPKRINGILRSNEMETSMFMSKDESAFFFVSNRKWDTHGGKDIFYSVKDDKGRWTEPVNMGEKVNTQYDEESVYLHPGGDSLFFSSQGHNSMGGFDVFLTVKDAQGNWGEPVNLGYPVNGPSDDIFYKLTDNPKKAFFSSVRDEGMGGKDIYELVYIGEEKELKMNDEDDMLVWYKAPVKDLFYRKPEKLIIDTSLFLIGKIYDATSNSPVMAKVQLLDKEKNDYIGTTMTDENGSYKIKLPSKKLAQKNFGVEINATGYMYFLDTVNLVHEQFKNDVANRDFLLEKIEIGAKMVMKNIYFETGKATLKSESFEELNRVVKFLENNPSVQIEISGHTDNVGSEQLNKKLSKERAKSVVEYLEAHGIEGKRMNYEGYGESMPIADNKSEDGRAQNRRVEFKILSTK